MRRAWALGGVLIAIGGCGYPQMVPVLPPGVEQPVDIATVNEQERAQAIGEARLAAAPRQDTGVNIPIEPAPPTEVGKPTKGAEGLVYETLRPGDGPEVRPGQTVKLEYVGRLESGRQFDSSKDQGRPYEFTLGVAGGPIKGWHLGVAGMRVGEVRRLTLPPNLGYGPNGAQGLIPPNATLIFDVELLSAE